MGERTREKIERESGCEREIRRKAVVGERERERQRDRETER